MKEILLHHWSFMRVFRVVAGIFLLGSAILQKETLVGGFGLFFLYTGLFNIQTCGMGGCYGNSCSTYQPFSKKEQTDDVEAELIK